ncbi:peptidoglycan editing factor PgeF [Dysgonomonas sp. Marseille-P4677]|uniref:peptidoglycan editing factor PgeF n=1 Tax=Dysgonomonas sp. Marseille-P4677 TaxID=2364790 RepID=UPI00191149F9|nr:peptidoglycan editing factor PgeF [Dysgonomonas sp. Marseille-P4677]MBK5720695.1 peptidoglycan editing factor PgeF [Dysgonomonas sp. Marseille-P4677]
MKSTDKNNIKILQFESFPDKNLFHFTSTIEGGASSDAYTSLNLGLYSGDNTDCVNENKERIANVMGISVGNLYMPYQTHEDKILVIDKLFLEKSDREKANSLNGIDALITDQKGICIGITTADCVPILIYDLKKNVLAAIHAGWKGTVAKIAAKTIKKMVDLFDCNTDDMIAGIGPCISQERFEVGEEVVDIFQEKGFIIEEIGYRNKKTGKMHFNLELTNKLIIHEAGIPFDNIECANLCTYSNPEMFFSARRQTIYSGRMVTGGILK